MNEERETTEVPEASPSGHVDPLQRLSRFFRRPTAVAGELPPPDAQDDGGEATAEFNVMDLRGLSADGTLFPLALWGGYDRAAVDERIAEMHAELEELRAQVDPEVGAEVEIQQLGNETAEILRVAHGKADALVKKAQAQSAALIAETEQRTRAMVADAEEQVRRLDHDTDVVWNERMRLTEDTRRLAQQLLQLADGAIERFPPEGDAPAA